MWAKIPMARHAIAMLIAITFVFGVHIQNVNLQPLLGNFDERKFETYTPYFPGLDNLSTHEIFSPENRHKKKIVLMGASAVDSIGCDYTWHRPKPNVTPNVHYTCSIAGQLNRLLKLAHLDDWAAFDLARNGSKLTDGLYIYTRILPLEPEIVVYGDSFNYYMWENADANVISPARYSYMDEVFGRYPETAKLWQSYKSNLERHGWMPTPSVAPEQPDPVGPKPRKATSINDLVANFLGELKSLSPANGMPHPVTFLASYRDFARPPYSPHLFENPDPDFGYFQGFKLIAEMQRRSGRHFSFFFCPQWDRDTDLDYQNGLAKIFGAYLQKDGIPFASYVPLKMTPIYETYDGYHHTVLGNRKIAEAIFHDLQTDGMLP